MDRGIEFLTKIYKDVNLDIKSNNPKKRMEIYIELQKKLHDLIKNSNHINLLKKLYYQKYVIKRENIPNKYFQNREKLLLENGYGRYNEFDKQKDIELIINNQKKSLEIWIDYFLSKDSNFYPMWVKYWVFQGMIKLGTYDKKRNKYMTRTKDTIAPFIELNREALALSIEFLRKYVEENKITNNKDLDRLIEGGSFQKIYTYFLKKINVKTDNNSNDGIWKKYSRGNKYMLLVKSLKNKNTGWCTASEEVAKIQLRQGDFYVYYTKDSNQKYTVPRIAIRMEADTIAEIRGVLSSQNVEPCFEQVLKEKIKELDNNNEYYKKVDDMKQMTIIYNKTINNEVLTKQELIFLYEIEEKIKSFGYSEDPRIEYIRNKRNKLDDLSCILKLDESLIGLDRKDVFQRKIVYFYGDLDLSDFKIIDKFEIPRYVYGNLYLTRLTNIDNVKLPDFIGGNLSLELLNEAKNLILPKIGGDIHLSGLKKVNRLVFKEIIYGSIFLSGLIEFQDIVFPNIIEGDLYLNKLLNINNLKLSKIVKGDIYLNSIEDLSILEKQNDFTCRGIYIKSKYILFEDLKKTHQKQLIKV